MFGISGPVAAALLSVYVFWGGTFLAARFALESMPPLMVTSTRFLVAGLLLYAFLWMRGLDRTGCKEWKNAAISGFLLLVSGNGVLVWGQQYIPSGIASIIPGANPMWIILFLWLGGKISKPDAATLTGLLLGLTGIMLLAGRAAAEGDGNYLLGICLAVTGSISWSAGSVYSKLSDKPKHPLQWAAMQMICGGSVLMALALLSGQWQKLDPADISAKSAGAVLYLIFCGSLFGYASYIWLLNNTSPSLAGTHAYVNPIVAVFVGRLFASEILVAREATAASVIVSAVALITMGNNRTAKTEN